MATGTKKKAARTQPATWFARRLRQAREQVGLTQTELGVRIGIDPSAASPRMNQYESGIHEPPHALVKRMAEELGVPLAYFFTEDDDRLAELLTIWRSLSPKSRKALVQFAQNDAQLADLATAWQDLNSAGRRKVVGEAKKNASPRSE